MNKLITISILAMASLLVFVPQAQAQAIIAQTTLSGSVTPTTTVYCLAASTGVTVPALASGAVGSYLLVDKEVATVTASGVGTSCFNVKRGQLGTRGSYHTTAAIVFVMGAAISSGDPSRPFSSTYFLGTVGQIPDYSPYTEILTQVSGIATHATTDASGTIYLTQVNVPAASVIQGVCWLNGATVTTDKHIGILWDGQGNLLGTTALAGTADSGNASLYECVALTVPTPVIGPAIYYAGVQSNGTTDTLQTYAAGSTPPVYGTVSQTGVFGTIPNITPPYTFTANVGPLMIIY
jgi:hypothetical protein